MIKKWVALPIFLLAILGLTQCASSDPQFELTWVWARPADIGMNSAIYFTIKNNGSFDSILSASSSIAETVEVHRSTAHADGTVSMVMQERVDVPGGERVHFQPGGLHVMLMGLKTPLSAGDTFPLKLEFEHAQDLTIEVTVQAP
jgi:copper(I)-binding protein